MSQSASATQENNVQENVDHLLARAELTYEEMNQIRRFSYTTLANRKTVRDAAARLARDLGKGAEFKVACLHYITREYAEALPVLKKHNDTELGAYVYACALMESGKRKEAEDFLKDHQKGGGQFLCQNLLCSILENRGELEAVEKILQANRKLEDTSGYQFHYGFMMEREGHYPAAQQAYERALQIDPHNNMAMFRLAYHFSLRGEDEKAIDLYERMRRNPPLQDNAMINLGILYEDAGRYEKAIFCYETVLGIYPDHKRADMYLKDAKASLTMHYDEDIEREQDKQKAILNTPVTDFELSVRSRNCLSKMNIRSLGDLIRKTEAELLSFKNFGETSLNEIKEMLTSRGLRLGMAREEEERKQRVDSARRMLEGSANDARSKPVSDLGLSVRSRKCMERLGVRTLGELAARKESDLLNMRNFGQSSINEIKQKLSEYGLSLRS